MKIKLFEEKKLEELTESDRKIVAIGLDVSDSQWSYRPTVDVFLRTGIGNILLFWEYLSDGVKIKAFNLNLAAFDNLILKKDIDIQPSKFKNTSNFKSLYLKGAENLFYPNHKTLPAEECKGLLYRMISENIDFVEKNILEMDAKTKYNFLNYISENFFYLLRNDFWTNFIVTLKSPLEQEHPDNIYKPEDELSLSILALELSLELGIETNYDNLFNYSKYLIKKNSARGDYVDSIIDLSIRYGKETVETLIKSSEFKSEPYRFRAYAYRAIIKAGLLSEKFARRLRSDSSEFVSNQCIIYLFKYAYLYDNKDKLISQFLDTRDSSVMNNLVEKAPDKYLPFLVGVKDSYAKKRLEERMKKAIENGTI
jgi:hypothetical protein